MTHAEILQAAKEVRYDWVFPSMPLEKLERFAAIIEKRTIERCAVVCDELDEKFNGEYFVDTDNEDCATAIRKLGEQ